ncbi:MAG: hypothetical protein JW829_11325 [Pirellulales bacterium]|nr:hypothetical protein [Pirellulales bacterium]
MDMEQRYQDRLRRYTTAMRNEMPDKIPIRPFAAEFTGVYAGYTCQELAHDYKNAFAAVEKCTADFDWDAVVPNMVWVWTGLTQAIGLNYYGVPGIDIPADVGFQYREPPPEAAFMLPDEYDALIDDPTAFLYNVWLPRVCSPVRSIGEPTSYANNLSFVKGGMAMLQYFTAFGEQCGRLRRETGTVSAIAGILKAPLDILADKLRGYLGLLDDLCAQPDKVLAACEALAPHLLHAAQSGADPDGNVPVPIWMHRGCVPFINPETFNTIYWPTLKPIIEELWASGHQTLFYAEGNWDHHLATFAELPDQSIIYHVDRGDIFKAHEVLGEKFCISGGIPNVLLAYGTPDQVRDRCKLVIDGVAQEGGYILDASAIMQNDTKIENIRAMTDFVRDYGVYSSSSSLSEKNTTTPKKLGSDAPPGSFLPMPDGVQTPVGACVPWDKKRAELPEITGDEKLIETVWKSTDALANMYIWQVLLSF